MRIFPYDFEATEGRRLTMLCSCGQGNLVVRRNPATGQRFLGCSRYPECKNTEPFQLEHEGQLDLFADLSGHFPCKVPGVPSSEQFQYDNPVAGGGCVACRGNGHSSGGWVCPVCGGTGKGAQP